MGVLNLLGCVLVAFSPAIAFFVLDVGKNPRMIILFILRCGIKQCFYNHLTYNTAAMEVGLCSFVPLDYIDIAYFSLFSLCISVFYSLCCVGCSGFFWLLSLFAAAVWWHIVPFMQDVQVWIVLWSVLFQEAFRVLFYLVIKYALFLNLRIDLTTNEASMCV